MRLLPTILLAAGVVGCGGEGGDDPVEGTGDPSLWTLTATLARPSVTLQRGTSDTVTVTVTRGGGFTGAVDIVADSKPGLSTAISNIRTSGTTTTALLTLVAGAASDIVYSIPIAVHVQATGVALRSDPTLTVNVTDENGLRTTAPGLLSIVRGGTSGPINVHFTKTGFTDPVTWSLPLFNAGPVGISGAFTPNPVAHDTNSTMIVSVDDAVPEGTYSAGVRVSGGGYEGTALMTIMVTPPALSITFCPIPLITAKNSNSSCLLTFIRTFLDPISMSVVSALPPGMTVTFDPNPARGSSTTMTVFATGAVASGTYFVSVASGGLGVPTVVVRITVTVP